MIPVEHDVARWREAYRREYGHDPPLRLEALKRLNRATVDGSPRPTLQSIAAKIPPKLKRRGRAPYSITPREVIEILDEYDRGDKLDTIAAKHGCSRKYVRQIARRAGRIGRVVKHG